MNDDDYNGSLVGGADDSRNLPVLAGVLMIQVFANGHGGKHRAGDPEATRWRALSTHTATSIRVAHPQMAERFVREQAELETEHVTHALNRRNKIEMGW